MDEATLARALLREIARIVVDAEPETVTEVPDNGRVRRPTHFSAISKYPISQLEPGEIFEIREDQLTKASLESAVRLAHSHTGHKYGIRLRKLKDGNIFQVFRKEPEDADS